MKNLRLSRLALFFALFAVTYVGCKKDEFTEEDLYEKELEKNLQEDSLTTAEIKLRDSLARVGGVVSYAVTAISAADAITMKAAFVGSQVSTPAKKASNLLDGVSVTVSQYGVAMTKTTDATGMVVFDDLRIGLASVTLSKADFSSAAVTVDLTDQGTSYDVDENTKTRSAATMVPLFALTGDERTTVSGVITLETDLTNSTPEYAPAGTEVVATLTPPSTWLDKSSSQPGQIVKISYSDMVTRATTDANGAYSMLIPSSALGLTVGVAVEDIVTTQTYYVFDPLTKKNVSAVVQRAVFSMDGVPSGINAEMYKIPKVPALLVEFAAPAGTATATYTDEAKLGTPLLSNDGIAEINVTKPGMYSEAPSVKITEGGDPTGIEATAVWDATTKAVTGVNITDYSSGYDATALDITFEHPAANKATADVIVGYPIEEIELKTNSGTNFTVAPTVEIEGGNGTGADAKAIMEYVVDDVTITNAGAGYDITNGYDDFELVVDGKKTSFNGGSQGGGIDLAFTGPLAIFENYGGDPLKYAYDEFGVQDASQDGNAPNMWLMTNQYSYEWRVEGEDGWIQDTDIIEGTAATIGVTAATDGYLFLLWFLFPKVICCCPPSGCIPGRPV